MDKLKPMNEVLAEVLLNEGGFTPQELSDKTRNSHILDYNAIYKIGKGYMDHKNLRENDKYKHALLNCLSAQNGMGGALIGSFLSGLREIYDVSSGDNTLKESHEDNAANNIGRLLGLKYPEGSCDEMVQKYIPRK